MFLFFGYEKITRIRCSGKCLNEAFVVILTLLSLEMPKEDVWWFLKTPDVVKEFHGWFWHGDYVVARGGSIVLPRAVDR